MKRFIIALINLLAVILCFDIKNIYSLYQFKDGAGIGIYIFSGLIEINDKVPYSKVPVYLMALSTVVVAIVIIDIYVLKNSRK
ncbi:MAG: hypothetical protein IJD80_02785 [Oscillospiraceae bacterium]|nr:hypothetical protein [Oscillospiraceae bacterium]